MLVHLKGILLIIYFLWRYILSDTGFILMKAHPDNIHMNLTAEFNKIFTILFFLILMLDCNENDNLYLSLIMTKISIYI